MKSNTKKIIILSAVDVILLFAAVGMAIFASIYNADEFNGVRVRNPDSYVLEIERMNGTDSHSMSLNVDSRLEIHLETKKGMLELKVKAPDGAVIYEGNGKAATDFSLRIAESGVYKMEVTAKRAKGVITVKAIN